jgi:HEAT repeat protein
VPGRRCVALILVASAAAACSAPPEGLDSPEPSKQLVAIARAAREEDPAAVPALIEMLDSEDAAVRLAAIRTLERIEHQSLGYDHAAPEAERRAKAAEWVDWYRRTRAGGGAAAAGPAPEEPSDR